MALKNWLGLCIYKIAPVKRSRYVFTSFGGHYSDNPKAISEKLHEIDATAEIVWLVNDTYQKNVPSYAKVVNIKSMKAYWYRGTATAQIDNVYGFRAQFKTKEGRLTQAKQNLFSFLTYKKRQPIFATMHGTAFKKIGRDQVGNVVLDMFCRNSHLMVGDHFTAEVLERVTFGKMKMSVLGAPRNDALFRDNGNLRIQLGLPKDKKIFLYAPTFRNDGIDVEGKNIYRSGLNQLEQMDFDLLFRSLEQKFGGDWVMVCRFHYHVAHMVDWDSLNQRYPGKFINGNQHDDMADYLVCSDILLTDASSCMYDFCHTQKPCFLFFPDIEHFRDRERGFYVDIESLPFSVATNFAELIENIENHDQIEYDRNVKALLTRIGSKNDGHASERVVTYILKNCNKNG